MVEACFFHEYRFTYRGVGRSDGESPGAAADCREALTYDVSVWGNLSSMDLAFRLVLALGAESEEALLRTQPWL